MLLPRPSEDPPRWATEETVDLTTGVSNVIEPPEEKKDAGWNRNEPPPRQWFNWFMRGTGEWLAFLAEQSAFIPINTATITGAAGVNALPEGFAASGIAAAVETDGVGVPTGNKCFGLILWLGEEAGWQIIPLIEDVLAFGTIADRTLPITGVGGGNEVIITTTVFGFSVINTP